MLHALSPISRPDIARCGLNGVGSNKKEQLSHSSIVKTPGLLAEHVESRASADDLISCGNDREDRDDVETALGFYRRALAVDPSYARAHLNIGNALRKLDRPTDAVAAFRDALQCTPDYFQARFNLGSLLASRGEFEAAETELREALRLEPELAEATVVLADVLEATQRPQDAETALV